MKRYIVPDKALDLLSITPLDALKELAKEKVITDEPLKFSNLGMVSLILDDYQIGVLRDNNVTLEEETIIENAALASDYEKVRSCFYKMSKRAIDGGSGVKVGVLDSGCNTAVVPAEFTVNFVDANPFTDVYGHGTRTSSIIKHPIIGLAPGCTFYHAKIMSDTGTLPESAVLAGLDYCIDQQLDIVNLSWKADTAPIRAAVAEVVASGIIVCASSGNETTETFTEVPACLPGVIAVNSIEENGGYFYLNVLPRSTIIGSHGISVACSGRGCQVYTKDNVLTDDFGTSFSAPFFVGVLALYKEAMDYADNDKVLEHALLRSKLTSYPRYSGAGTPSF